MNKKFYRARFKAGCEDYRPIHWPIDFPYWCSGYDAEDNPILIAYVESKNQIFTYWPEATEVDMGKTLGDIIYSDRFPKPDYMEELEALDG